MRAAAAKHAKTAALYAARRVHMALRGATGPADRGTRRDRGARVHAKLVEIRPNMLRKTSAFSSRSARNSKEVSTSRRDAPARPADDGAAVQ